MTWKRAVADAVAAGTCDLDTRFFGLHTLILADANWIGTPAEMHRRAKAILRQLQRGSIRNENTGWDIFITSDGRDKTLYEKRSADEFQAVEALENLLRYAIRTDSAPDRSGRPDVTGFHHLYAPLQIGSRLYCVQ